MFCFALKLQGALPIDGSLSACKHPPHACTSSEPLSCRHLPPACRCGWTATNGAASSCSSTTMARPTSRSCCSSRCQCSCRRWGWTRRGGWAWKPGLKSACTSIPVACACSTRVPCYRARVQRAVGCKGGALGGLVGRCDTFHTHLAQHVRGLRGPLHAQGFSPKCVYPWPRQGVQLLFELEGLIG